MKPLTIVTKSFKGWPRTTRELWDYIRRLNTGYRNTHKQWVPSNNHDELERAMNKIEQKQAVVDAACHYIHNVLAGHHGPNDSHTKKALIALHQEVDAYLIQEMDF